MNDLRSQAKLYWQRWWWYERNNRPLNRLRINWHLLRRDAYARWPLHGDVLEAFEDGRLEIGPHVLMEPGVWISAPAPARVRIGGGTFLNKGIMIAAVEKVEIGEHCMFANGCFITDGSHRFDDPDKPVTWQGFSTKGRPTRIGANVWLGVNVAVMAGVTIGERCVIGANSVVTKDIPPFSIAAGSPARVLRKVEYGSVPSHPGTDPPRSDE